MDFEVVAVTTLNQDLFERMYREVLFRADDVLRLKSCPIVAVT